MKKLHLSALVKSVAVVCFSASLIQVAHAEQSETTTIENKV
ncbi:MAG: hypothetical protein XXXJIFNMEKO3_00332 [Candidatus Erwinia impunctatus]|nr:hypothetical protein XXXJIFNMEKO_00332 [Culicoides impunctatus]